MDLKRACGALIRAENIIGREGLSREFSEQSEVIEWKMLQPRYLSRRYRCLRNPLVCAKSPGDRWQEVWKVLQTSFRLRRAKVGRLFFNFWSIGHRIIREFASPTTNWPSNGLHPPSFFETKLRPLNKTWRLVQTAFEVSLQRRAWTLLGFFAKTLGKTYGATSSTVIRRRGSESCRFSKRRETSLYCNEIRSCRDQ